MFEIIKIIIETVSKALDPSLITKYRKQKKLAELGKELFQLYTHLNEVIVTGHEIVGSLEVYIQRMSRHLSHNDDAHALTAGKWIRFALVQQQINLARLGRTIQRMNRELDILDGESHRRLHRLIEGKRNALDMLLSVLGGRQLPLVMMDEETLLKLIDTKTSDARDLDWSVRAQIENELSNVLIPTTTEWNKEIFERVSRYLTERKPRLQLEQLEEVAKNLHDTLKANFDIGDILLQVSDERYSSRYHGEYFW